MNQKDIELSNRIDANLLSILAEVRLRTDGIPAKLGYMSPSDSNVSIQEYVDIGEKGIAYELLAITLEENSIAISGESALKLLDVALLFGCKTDRTEDDIFNKHRDYQDESTWFQCIYDNLLAVFNEVHALADGKAAEPGAVDFSENNDPIVESIKAGKYASAYDKLVLMLEKERDTIAGEAAVKLMEAGLLLGFKTERPEDAAYDRRKR